MYFTVEFKYWRMDLAGRSIIFTRKMKAEYSIEPDGSIKISLKIKPIGSFLEQEEQIAQGVAEVGRLASLLVMEGHDKDGRPLIIDNQKYTSRGVEKKSSKRRTEK